MAKLADVNYSRQGEPEKTELPMPAEHQLPGQQGIEPEVKYVIFKLAKTDRNGGIYIPNIDDAINPKTGKMERMRLLVGVDTIWMSEQKDLDKGYIEKNGRPLYFPRGAKFIRIPEWDHTALEFARLCRHNIGNKNRKTGSKTEFYEWNPLREAKAAEEKELLELEMAIKAKEMPIEKMRKHASFLHIQFIDPEMGIPKPDEKIRAEYMLYAKRNAALFKQTMDSEEIDIQYAIKMAIMDAKIDVGSQPGTAFWTDSRGVIGKIPEGKNTLQYLTELALTNIPDGIEFKKKLKSLRT